MDLMKEYTFFVHTTKSNVEPDNNRFRMVIPIAYELELDKEDYKEFMNNMRRPTWAWIYEAFNTLIDNKDNVGKESKRN